MTGPCRTHGRWRSISKGGAMYKASQAFLMLHRRNALADVRVKEGRIRRTLALRCTV